MLMDNHFAEVELGAQPESTSFRQDPETDIEGLMTSLAPQPFTIFKALLYTGLHLVLVSSFHMFVSYNDQRHTGNTWVAELSLKPGPQTLPKTKAPTLQTDPPTCVWESLPYATANSYSAASSWHNVTCVWYVTWWWPGLGGAPRSLERIVLDFLGAAAKQPAGSLC